MEKPYQFQSNWLIYTNIGTIWNSFFNVPLGQGTLGCSDHINRNHNKCS